MKYCYLGRAGIKVSRLCLGTANFAGGGSGYGNWGSVPEGEAHRIMDAALEAGINFFDTANVYGNFGEGGHCGMSEEIIGRWFKQGGGRRERTVLGTKLERVMEQDEHDGPNKPRGLSLYKIRRHFAASLKRLQTDHVELLTMHHPDRRTGWQEMWEAFEGLVRSNQLDYVGGSNFAAWDMMKAQEAARKRNFMGLVSEQHRYNLLCRLPELEVIPAALDQGIGITLYSPLWRGLLGYDILAPQKRSLSKEALAIVERYRPQLTDFAKLCHDIHEEPANVALAWELANPAIVAPIIGPASMEDLVSSLRAVEITLSESTMKRLDEIFPGPAGDAVEAYGGWSEMYGR